ncbi:MAG: hypothetical protein Q4A70_02900 [Candidatus Saccharibacteria bacterium]|nr:hypothetical protein [Candidatus Saccharibacteria bacterium]
MKLKDLLIAICGGVGFIAVFLPWFSVSAFGMSATGNGFDNPVVALGILSLIIGLVVAAWKLLTMFGLIKINLTPKLSRIVDSALGGAMVLFGIIAIIIINTQSAGFAAPGFGVFLLIIAGIAQVILTWTKIDKTVGNAPKKQ